MPRRLLRAPAGEDRVEQRLLEPQRPHALTEHARERGVDLGGAIPPLSALPDRRRPAFHLTSHPFIRRNGLEGQESSELRPQLVAEGDKPRHRGEPQAAESRNQRSSS
ncbi:MAG: hypothetical protein ACRDK0_02860 [Solirubrobacteraceae bacterium]